MKTKIKFLAMMLMGIMLSTNVWGEDASYTITFATGSGDGTSVSTSTACSGIVSAGATYLSGNLVTATKVYGSGGSGLKLGTSSDQGTIKMNLSDAGKVTPTSIVVRAKRYSSSKATKIALNGKAAQDISADFANYTFDVTTAITYLEIVSSKGTSGGAYAWIESITVNYESAPATPCTVTFNAGTGRCSTTSLTEASAGAGVTLPTVQASVGCAAIGWTFAGWATASQTETTTAPTLYAAGSNYKPSADCTLHAVYSLTPESPAGAAPVGTVLWSEDWSGESPLNNYDKSDGFEGSIQSGTMSAGRTEPELLLKSYDAVTTKSAINLQGAKTLEATLYSNRNYIKINGNTGTNVEGKLYRYKWSVEESVTSINLTIASNGSDNARVDDITLKVAAPDVTYNSNPECAAPVRISWRVQSDQYAEDEINTQVTIVPANPNPAEYSCGENAVFVGWTTSDNYSNHSTAPTPLYKTEAEIKALVLTEDITFYAVFATKVINN